MKRKIVVDISEKVRENEVLVWTDKGVESYEIHKLLPDLAKAKKEIAKLKEEIAELNRRIRRAELELALDRGDLTEEEYDNELSNIG